MILLAKIDQIRNIFKVSVWFDVSIQELMKKKLCFLDFSFFGVIQSSRSFLPVRFTLLFGILLGVLQLSGPVFGQGPLPPDITQDPQSFELYNTAKAYFEKGEDTLAINGFQEFLSRYPQHSLLNEAYLYLGHTYFRNLEYGKAINIFNTSLRNISNPSLRSPTRRGLVDAYMAVEMWEKAIPILEIELELEEQRDGRVRLENQLLESYTGGKFYFKSIQILLNRLKKFGEDPEEEDILREQVREIMSYDLAEKELLEVIEQIPGQFPSDLALLKLIERYEFFKDSYRLRKVLDQFIHDFPGHEFIERQKVLRENLEEGLIEKDLIVGALLPLTGPLKPYATSILNGIQLALSPGSDIKTADVGLYVIDTEGKSVKVQEGMRELMEDYDPIGIVGPLLSKEVLSVIPKAERYRVPIITPTATRKSITEGSSYLFRNAITNEMQVDELAEFTLHHLGLKHIVILYPEGEYGKDLARLFAREVLERGKEIIFIDSYGSKEKDFKQVLRKLKIADLQRYGVEEEIEIPPSPLEKEEEDSEKERKRKIERVYIPGFDAIFLPGTARQAGLLAPQLAFHNFSRVTLLGSNGWNSEELVEVGGEFMEGAIFVDSFFVNHSSPHVQDFVRLYYERYQKKPDVYSALAYDSGRMILQAIFEGAESGPDLRRFLQKTQNFQGVSGLTTVSSNGEMIKELVFLTVRNGKITQAQ